MSHEFTDKEKLNAFLVNCFYSILSAEERALEPLSGGQLSLKEIHVIEAVFLTKKIGENNFSSIAKRLGVTLGTLTASFSRLEKKGCLYKVRAESDKRIYYIELTPLGLRINEVHTEFHKQMVEEIVGCVSKKELHHLVSALGTLDRFFSAAQEQGK